MAPDGTITELGLPTAGSGPYDVTLDAAGSLWFTENSANKVGRFDLATTVYWTGLGDGVNWEDPENWSIHALPDYRHDVYILATARGDTVVHTSGDVSVHSLHDQKPLNFTGNLSLATVSEISNAFTFNGAMNQGTGELTLSGGGAITGSITAASAASIIHYANGSFTDNGTLDDGDGTFAVGNNALAFAAADVEIEVKFPKEEKANYKLQGGDTLTLSAQFRQTQKTFQLLGGIIRGDGSLVIADGAVLDVNGKAQPSVVQDVSIVNEGSANLSGMGKLVLDDRAQFYNGGTFRILDGSTLAWGATGVPAPGSTAEFFNRGLFVSRSAGGDNVLQVRYNVDDNGGTLPTGRLQVDSGTLRLQGGLLTASLTSSPAADFSVAADAQLVLEKSPFVNVNAKYQFVRDANLLGQGRFVLTAGALVASNLVVDNLTLGAPTADVELDGLGTILVTGQLDWSAANVFGTGLLKINPTGRATLQSFVNVTIDARLENLGLVTVTSRFDVHVDDRAEITNRGTWRVTGDSTLEDVGTGRATFTNLGLFEKTAFSPQGSGSTVVEISFTNAGQGTVDVQAGTLRFTQEFKQTGGLTRLNGTALEAPKVTISGGELVAQGVSRIKADTLANGGTLDFGGDPLGRLSIEGDYVRKSGGALEMLVGGDPASDTFDQIAILGKATIDGSFRATSVNGFQVGTD